MSKQAKKDEQKLYKKVSKLANSGNVEYKKIIKSLVMLTYVNNLEESNLNSGLAVIEKQLATLLGVKQIDKKDDKSGAGRSPILSIIFDLILEIMQEQQPVTIHIKKPPSNMPNNPSAKIDGKDKSSNQK